MAKRFAAGNKRTVYKASHIPIPPEILQNAQMKANFEMADQFMKQVQAKWGVEVYRLTIAHFQKLMAGFHQQAQVNAQQLAARVNANALKALSGSQTVTTSQFRFYANLPQFTKHMQKYVGQDVMYFRIYQKAMDEFIPIVKYELANILSKAAAQQEEGAFPERYVRPMLYLVNSMDISQKDRVGVKPYFAGLNLPNLETVLGNYDDFERAFHHKALLKTIERKGNIFREMRSDITKGRVDVSELRQPDPARRYLYWKALYEGKKSFTVNADFAVPGPEYRDKIGRFAQGTSIERRKIEIPITGDWDATITARLYVWNSMGKAPQWLLLEHGQPRYKPKIKTTGFSNPPNNITGEWVKVLSQRWQEIVRRHWDDQVDKFNNTPLPPDIPIVPQESVIQPHIKPIEVQNLIRVTSAQYGTSYYSYMDYLDRRIGQFFQLGNRLVRTNELEFYRLLKGRYIR